MDPRGLRVTKTTYFSLITHAKKLSLVTLCDTTARIERNGSVTDRRTDSVKSEIVTQILPLTIIE